MKKSSSNGPSLGLIRARLVRNPEFISKKETKVSAAEMELANAANPYEKRKATKNLQTLKGELENLHQQQQADEKELDRILNLDEAQIDAAA